VTAARTAQLHAELVQFTLPPTGARVAQLHAEAVTVTRPPARVAQLHVEVVQARLRARGGGWSVT
jgi:hypothetical protein